MKPLDIRVRHRLRARQLLLPVLALAAVAAIACTPETHVTVQPGQDQPGITVSGRGTAEIRPDIARVALGVEVTEPTVAEARELAAGAMQAIQDSLAGNGIEESDIQTKHFRVQPQYDYRQNQQPRIIGFIVTNSVTVKVHDIDSVSPVLDDAIEAGGDAARVHSIDFTVDEPEEHLNNARTEAMDDARAHAQVLADAAGVTLGAPRSVSESINGRPEPYPAARDGAMQADDAVTPILPGEEELEVRVTVVFDID